MEALSGSQTIRFQTIRHQTIRLPASGFRLPASGFRLQTSDYGRDSVILSEGQQRAACCHFKSPEECMGNGKVREK